MQTIQGGWQGIVTAEDSTWCPVVGPLLASFRACAPEGPREVIRRLRSGAESRVMFTAVAERTKQKTYLTISTKGLKAR